MLKATLILCCFGIILCVENDKPYNGIVADLLKQTRTKYHHVCKMVLKQDAEIRCDKMAEAIVNNDNKSFRKLLKSCLPKKATYPTDDADSQAEIADLFADKFHNLYNSVSYIEADLDILKHDIDNMIDVQCTKSSHCTHVTHSIIANDVIATIKKLKHDKNDGASEVVSDHIIYSCRCLSVHLSLLFTTMLRHGLTPDDMLNGTMVPI